MNDWKEIKCSQLGSMLIESQDCCIDFSNFRIRAWSLPASVLFQKILSCSVLFRESALNCSQVTFIKYHQTTTILIFQPQSIFHCGYGKCVVSDEQPLCASDGCCFLLTVYLFVQREHKNEDVTVVVIVVTGKLQRNAECAFLWGMTGSCMTGIVSARPAGWAEQTKISPMTLAVAKLGTHLPVGFY